MSTPLSSILGDARDIPVRVSNAATDFVLADRGGCVRKSDTSTPTWTVRNDTDIPWSGGISIIVANDGASGNVTIAPGAGVTLTAGTTTGAFALSAGESRLLHRVAANTWRLR